MVHKASVIKVDRSDECHFIIAKKHFGMNESGGVFIDVHACVKQVCVVGASDLENGLFVGDVGSDDPYVHTALGCRAQGGF